MATYNVHAGHNYYVTGASGQFSETEQNRVIKNKVIAHLKAAGHTVYDCTDEVGKTKSANLANIVSKQNAHSVDLDISIHFNAFNKSAHGSEVLIYNDKTRDVATRICNNLAVLGFTNRGVKNGSNLYVLRKSKSKAILVECCFCDSPTDAKIYNADKVAKAIAEGILNKTISASTSSSTTSTPTTTKLYRVRKTWSDAKSQLGAYAVLDNAKKNCPSGYTVYDWDGKAVYSNIQSTSSSTNTELYRVRKTWDDAKSQLGAFKELQNAINACIDGYSVFNSSGTVVYTKAAAKEETKEEDKEPVVEVTPEVVAPEAEDISPLKGVDTTTFIEYVGDRAKEDMKKTGILASVTIAQAILESAWGQSELSLKANNLFGMKANLSGNTWASEWEGKIYAKRSPEEDTNGNVEYFLSDFRAYDSVEKSIKDHSDYLCGAMNGSVLRYAGLKGEKDYKKAIQIIKDGGYATDSKYVDKVINIIETYDLDMWDDAMTPSEIPDEEKDTPVETPPLEDTKDDVPVIDTEDNVVVDKETTTNLLKVIIELIKKVLSLFSK